MNTIKNNEYMVKALKILKEGLTEDLFYTIMIANMKVLQKDSRNPLYLLIKTIESVIIICSLDRMITNREVEILAKASFTLEQGLRSDTVFSDN